MKLKKPIASLVSALLLSFGMVAMATSTASAHDNVVSGVGTCQQDGTYTVTWTVKNDYNRSEVVNEVSSAGGGTLSGLPVLIGASSHYPSAYKSATVTQSGVPGTATSAYLKIWGKWSDAYSRTSEARVVLAGNCETQPTALSGTTTGTDAPVCATPANGTATEVSWKQGWTQAYVWNASKATWVLGEKVYGAKVVTSTTTVDLESCMPSKPAPKTGTETRTDAVVCASPLDGTGMVATESRSWTQAYTWDAGSHSYVLGNKVYGSWTVTKTSVVTDATCAVAVTAVFPEPVPPTCTSDGSLPGLPTNQAGITFSWDASNPLKMVATADKGYVLTGATSRTYSKPGVATGDCYVTPAPVTVAPQTCQVGEGGVADFTGGSITLPTTAGVTYTVTTAGGKPVTVTGGTATGLAPGDYVVTATPAQGEILTTGEKSDWVLGEATATTTVTVVAASDCAIVQPDPKVTSTAWVDGTWACGDTTVKQTREVTTTPYVWSNGGWVLDATSASTVTETQTRDLLASEQTVCSQVLAAPPNTVVTIVPPTCTADGSATLADGVGYTWDKTSFGPGTWTATATVTDGYAFDHGTTAQVTFTVAPKLTGSACTFSEVLAAPPNASVPTASSGVLAFTGATPLPLAIVAIVLLGAGALLQPRVRKAIFARH